MLITIHDEYFGTDTKIDTSMRDRVVSARGALLCQIVPWEGSGCPLRLEIGICPDGRIIHRGWDWSGEGNCYLHVKNDYCAEKATPTPEMAETIAGLFSGRITVQGLKLGVGASVQEVCPIDLEAEEARAGKKIYLA